MGWWRGRERGTRNADEQRVQRRTSGRGGGTSGTGTGNEKRREKRPGAMRAPPRPRFQRPTTQLVHLLLSVQPPTRVCLMHRATLRPDGIWQDANLLPSLREQRKTSEYGRSSGGESNPWLFLFRRRVEFLGFLHSIVAHDIG